LESGTLSKLAEVGEKSRIQTRKQVRGLRIAGFSSLGLALLFIFLAFIYSDSDFITVLVSLGLLLLVLATILLVVASSRKRKYQNAIMTSLRDLIEKETYGNVERDPRHGFDLQFLLSTDFFIKPDRYIGSNFTSGEYLGIPFQYADYDLQRRETREDSKGHVTVTYVSYARGRMYHFDLKRTFKESLLIMEKSMLDGIFTSKRNLVETESIAFNEKFRTYASLKDFAFYILTPQVQEALLKMEAQNGGAFHYLLRDDEIFISLQNSLSFPQPGLKEELTEEILYKLADQYLFPAVAIDGLDLNSTKYTPNAGTGAEVDF